MKTTAIQEFMTKTPKTIGAEQTIETAHRLMSEANIRHLPVLKGGSVVGLISLRDIDLLLRSSDSNAKNNKVEDSMSSTPYTTEPTTSLKEVVKHMVENQLGSCLVTHHTHVVGIFTEHDALRVLNQAL